jgi:hypothetical protein
MEDRFDIHDIINEMKKDKIKRAKERTTLKRPSLLDSIGIKEFTIPDEINKKDIPKRNKEDLNVISEDTIGDYSLYLMREDYELDKKEYLICIDYKGNPLHPLSEMLTEEDFKKSVNIYLSIVNNLKNQQSK